MDRAEILKSDMRKRIKQIEHIMYKLQCISGFRSNTTVSLFHHKLEEKRKHFKNALSTPQGWMSYESISKSDSLTNSILVGNRLEIFALEIYYEELAIRYHNAFFGFYNPEPFKLFGTFPDYIYYKGKSGGLKQYNEIRTAVQNDPSLILKEREKITAYLKKGWEYCVSKRKGEPFPIDLTIPEGY